MTTRSPGVRSCKCAVTARRMRHWRKKMLRRNAIRKACFETLEGRALMSATIAGSVMRDLTGNGLTADDTPMGGAAVKLYKDLNGNGILDATDGAAIATKTTAADGSYSFGGLAIGKYLLADAPAANQVRTAPVLSNTI